MVRTARTIRLVGAKRGTRAWDISCKGNHNFIAGKGLFLAKNTNLNDLSKLISDPSTEALRDRTVRVDIPYLTEWKDETKVLEHDYGKHRIQQHIAPHTIKIAALWAILTRLKPDADNRITSVEKAKLYDGQALPGWTEDSVKELRDKIRDEGLVRGVSARFVQNAISNSLVSGKGYVNAFMVLHELSVKLDYLIISDENDRDFYRTCLTWAKQELEEILKTEVQRAIVGDNLAIERLFQNYIDNIVAYIDGSKIRNPLTGDDVPPDESLMRSVEEMADISDQYVDDFRRQIAQFIGSSHIRGRDVRWDSNPRLARALEKKLFEDSKDTIKLAKISSASGVIDKDLQEKIDAIKTRLIKNFGYNEQSATDVLHYVSSIFARGSLVENN